MSVITLSTPADVSPDNLARLIGDLRQREARLRGMMRRFEVRYGVSLADMESRLTRGAGSEHPDWEDSIEWRNALEALDLAQRNRKILEWLSDSMKRSSNS